MCCEINSPINEALKIVPVWLNSIFFLDLANITHYHKVPKFSDARKICCKLTKIQSKRFYPGVIPQKDANRKANNEDSDQTAPLGAV